MRVEIGGRYGRLLVVGLIKDKKNPRAICKCDCGNEATPQRGALVSGKSQSCGCLRIEKVKKAVTTHGKSKSADYMNWNSMKQRCSNKNDPAYKNYGARGISVSSEWMDYETFMFDMGARPEGMTLERIDTNGPYSKNNCYWGSWTEQAVNKRVSKRWLINGMEFISSKEAAKHLGVDTSVVNRRTNGYWRNGIWHDSVPGYTSRLAYDPA